MTQPQPPARPPLPGQNPATWGTYNVETIQSGQTDTAPTSINTGSSTEATAGEPDSTIVVSGGPTVDVVSQDVIDAITNGVTRVTRRIEIYESDGTTVWRSDLKPRLVSGSINVDQGNESRRNLDLVIDNGDKAIQHNSDDGLWYDKIIKVFRGVTFQPQRISPRIAVIGGNEAATPNMRTYLAHMGFTDITYLSITSAAAILKNYDIVALMNYNGELSATNASILKAVFDQGGSVITSTTAATEASIPMMTSTTIVGTAGTITLTGTNRDNPFAESRNDYRITKQTGDRRITGLAAGAYAVLVDSANSVNQFAAYWTNSNGGRWFHYNARLQLETGASTRSDVVYQNIYLQAVMWWLFNYKSTKAYETQVGEFMIDRISEPRFPRTIAITGRDYSKKLDLAEYDYTTLYKAGLNTADVLTGIAQNAGIKKFRFSIPNDPDYSQLSADAGPFAKGSSRADAFSQICTGQNLEWFFDRYGYLVVRQFLDPATSPTTLTIKAGGTDGNLVEFTKVSDDTEMYNVVNAAYLSGNSSIDVDPDGKYQFILENNDPESPTNIARVGRRTKVLTSPLWNSLAKTKQAAKSYMAVSSLEAFEIDFDMLCYPWLEVGEILEFVDPDSDDTFAERHLLTSYTIPLDLSPSSGVGKRVGIVKDNGTVANDSTAA